MADFNFGEQPATRQESSQVVLPTFVVQISLAVIAALLVDRLAKKAPLEVVIS